MVESVWVWTGASAERNLPAIDFAASFLRKAVSGYNVLVRTRGCYTTAATPTRSASHLGGSYARYLHSLQITGKKSFAQDGLSGGPVYQIAKDRDGYHIGLAGIMVRGGNDIVHFIDARFVLSLARFDGASMTIPRCDM